MNEEIRRIHTITGKGFWVCQIEERDDGSKIHVHSDRQEGVVEVLFITAEGDVYTVSVGDGGADIRGRAVLD
jgi:hypothetical protein